MGTQFWWFYDAAAVALILICIYSCGKKGFSRLIALITGYVVCIVASFIISDKAAEYIYKNYVKQRDIAKIEQLLEENSISRQTESLLEEMGYSDLSTSGIAATLVQDGTAGINTVEMVESMLADRLPLFVPDDSAELLEQIGYDGIEELFMLMETGSSEKAAEYIEENYTGVVSQNIIRLICFIISLFVLVFVMKILISSLGGGRKPVSAGGIINHTLGGAFGAVKGIFAVFLLAAAVRVLIAAGNDEMMFFNSSAVDRTMIFKHIYNWTAEI